ncbi:MAG: protein kinase [Acidobacteria bacterium]|nr:protein kinase [Acidobacteriota bacterium]
MHTGTPSKLGRYEVLEELGKGSMGVVYLARDPLIGRLVALKTFHVGHGLGDTEIQQFHARFLREAQSCGILSHPNIVTIHDIVVPAEPGDVFMAMEYVRGSNLKQLLQRAGRPELEFTARVVCQIADALDYAHSKGVVHRDVKPANILLTADNQVKITDFGIALLNTSNLTQDGQMLGTPNYMAPEQIRGTDVDHRADIFSLGVVLYEMLTRRKPFPGDNLTVVTYRIVNESFDPPEQYVGKLHPGLREVLERALAKNPDDRFTTASEMAAELRRLLPVASTPLVGENTAELLAETMASLPGLDLPELSVPPPPVLENEPDFRLPVPSAPASGSDTRPPLLPPPEPPEPIGELRAEDGEGSETRPPLFMPEPPLPEITMPSLPEVAAAAPPPPPSAPPPAAVGPGTGEAVAPPPESAAATPAATSKRPIDRRRLALLGAVAVVALLLVLLTLSGLRRLAGPDTEAVYGTEREAARQQVEQLLSQGRSLLDEGRIDQADTTFGQLLELAEARRDAVRESYRERVAAGDRREAETRSEELEWLAARIGEGEDALRQAEDRRQQLAFEAARDGVVRDSMESARIAFEEERFEDARAAALTALEADPGVSEAYDLLADLEPQLTRTRRAETRPEPRPPPPPTVVAPKPAETQEVAQVEPPPPVVVPDHGVLEVTFTSDLPRGVLLIYLNEDQLLREDFRFIEKTGLFKRPRSYTGNLERRFEVATGTNTLKVYVSGARNRPTEVEQLTANFPAGATRRLTIRVSEDGAMNATLH